MRTMGSPESWFEMRREEKKRDGMRLLPFAARGVREKRNRKEGGGELKSQCPTTDGLLLHGLQHDDDAEEEEELIHKRTAHLLSPLFFDP